jgi:DNA-binding transcriptional ArsR family regulator
VSPAVERAGSGAPLERIRGQTEAIYTDIGYTLPMSLLDVVGSTGRLKILRELSQEPKYVSQLTDAVGMDGKTATHHLDTLEEAGLIDFHWKGNRKYYRLVSTVELHVAPPPERAFILQADDDGD